MAETETTCRASFEAFSNDFRAWRPLVPEESIKLKVPEKIEDRNDSGGGTVEEVSTNDTGPSE